MAKITLGNIKFLGNISRHTATSYQIAKDPDFKDIIDESIEDKTNLFSFESPLPDGNGGFYKDLPAIYCRFKFHFSEQTSKWFYIDPENQNTQETIFIHEDGTTEIYSESDSGWIN